MLGSLTQFVKFFLLVSLQLYIGTARVGLSRGSFGVMFRKMRLDADDALVFRYVRQTSLAQFARPRTLRRGNMRRRLVHFGNATNARSSVILSAFLGSMALAHMIGFSLAQFVTSVAASTDINFKVTNGASPQLGALFASIFDLGIGTLARVRGSVRAERI